MNLPPNKNVTLLLTWSNVSFRGCRYWLARYLGSNQFKGVTLDISGDRGLSEGNVGTWDETGIASAGIQLLKECPKRSNRRSVLVHFVSYLGCSRDVLFGYRRFMCGNFGVTKGQWCQA